MSGCSFFAPPRFDNNEYFFFVELETHARYLVDECSNVSLVGKRMTTMRLRSETLQTYSYYLPRRSELYNSSNLINKQIVELAARYNKDTPPPSTAYCTIKAKILIKELRRILTTAGKLQEVYE